MLGVLSLRNAPACVVQMQAGFAPAPSLQACCKTSIKLSPVPVPVIPACIYPPTLVPPSRAGAPQLLLPMLHFVSALTRVTRHVGVSLFAVDPCPVCASTVVTKFILDQLLALQAQSEGNRYGVSTFALYLRCRQCLLSTDNLSHAHQLQQNGAHNCCRPAVNLEHPSSTNGPTSARRLPSSKMYLPKQVVG